MGFKDRMREIAAEMEAETAQRVWDSGQRGYVWRAIAFNDNTPQSMTMTLDAILAVGWQLHSTAAASNTTGPNSEVVFFTFVRP